MHIFYSPDIDGSYFTLSEEESKHCIKVLRLSSGDKIKLLNGKGGVFTAEIIEDHPKRCKVEVKEIFQASQRSWSVEIALAATKSMDRLEWFVEKATEIGIDSIVLLDCQNSERTIVKEDRLIKVAVAAIKQSISPFLPSIKKMQSFEDYVNRVNAVKSEKFIAHCQNSSPLPHLKNLYHSNKNAIVMIGPEGDFTVGEVDYALKNGFKEIGLGSKRLRTETAALYACAALNLQNE